MSPFLSSRARSWVVNGRRRFGCVKSGARAPENHLRADAPRSAPSISRQETLVLTGPHPCGFFREPPLRNGLTIAWRGLNFRAHAKHGLHQTNPASAICRGGERRGGGVSTSSAEQSGRREHWGCISRFASCIPNAFFEATAEPATSTRLLSWPDSHSKSDSSATMTRLRPWSFARDTATSTALRNFSALSSARAV